LVTNLQRAVVVSDFISRSVVIVQWRCEIYEMIGHQRLTDVMVIRQMATLTRTVARRSLVVTHIVFKAHTRALIESLRVANRRVACRAVTD